MSLLESVRSAHAGASSDEVVGIMKGEILGILKHAQQGVSAGIALSASPTVIMIVGVNGAGKTTTTAKLAAQFKAQGKRVLLVAADTFRAGAVQQLQVWGQRLDLPVVTGADNAKPSGVVFEALERRHEADVILIDTAGRLQTKKNLMDELSGVSRVIKKAIPEGPHETLLVLDGTSGQNGLSQARLFHEAVALTGLIVTKLDGTPKGGVVVAVSKELGVPIRYIGVGESVADLRPFDAEEFVDALLAGRESDGNCSPEG
jgi:fused signal recognition particle receptor